MACHLDGAKPLSEPMLEYFYWTFAANCSGILIEIYTFSFKKMHFKMSFCRSLDVLIGTLWGESTGYWWFPSQRVRYEQPLCLLCSLHWRHNGRESVSNHQPHDCLLNRLFRPRWKKISKLRVTGHRAGNSPETGEFPAQMASNAENVSIWWHHESKLWNKPSICWWFEMAWQSK